MVLMPPPEEELPAPDFGFSASFFSLEVEEEEVSMGAEAAAAAAASSCPPSSPPFSKKADMATSSFQPEDSRKKRARSTSAPVMDYKNKISIKSHLTQAG